MAKKDPNTIIEYAWKDWIEQLPLAALNQAGFSDWYAMTGQSRAPEGEVQQVNGYLNAWEQCAYHIWYAVEEFAQKPDDFDLSIMSIARLNAMSQWINSVRRSGIKAPGPYARR